MFIDVKLQRLCSHQCIASSKVSEKLDKSLYVRDKSEDLCWMPVVFGPTDTVSLIFMILSLRLLNGPGILPETTVGKHNPPCHLQMPSKALSCKKEAYVNMVQKQVLRAKAHLKSTVSDNFTSNSPDPAQLDGQMFTWRIYSTMMALILLLTDCLVACK